jgi:DNA-binding beta-propeller fold protein YncE
VYVTDTGNKRISVFEPDGSVVESFGGEGMDEGQFSEPTSLAFDPETGDLFVADLWNTRVQRFDADGNFILEWPVDGWDSTEPAHKAYIAVGPGSVVAVSDPEASRVWVYTNDGTVLAKLDFLQDSLGLDQPVGVAFDAQGRIYVASSNSGVITRYAALPEVLKAAGLPADAGEDDEGAADDAAAADEETGDDDVPAEGVEGAEDVESGESEGAEEGSAGDDAEGGAGAEEGDTAPTESDAGTEG